MEHRVLSLMLGSLALAGASAAIAMPPGIVLGWLVGRTDLCGRRAIGLTLVAMLFMPIYLQAAAWDAALGLQGWLTPAAADTAWLSGFRAAAWIHGLAAVPWVALFAAVGFRQVEPELEEAALLDGSAWQVFLRVTLRRAAPAIACAALWAVILAVGETTVTDLFSVRTYAEEVYTQFALASDLSDAPRALLPGMAMTAVMFALVVWLAAVSYRGAATPGRRAAPLVRKLGRWQVPGLLFAVGTLVLLVGVPLLSLLTKAGIDVVLEDGTRIRTWSLAKCVDMIARAPWDLRRELGWSLAIGSLAATAAVAIALPLAWFARRGTLAALPALGVAALSVALPGPVLAVSIAWLMTVGDWLPVVRLYQDTIFAPWLVAIARALPPALLVIWYAARSIPQGLLDAAAVDGAGVWRRMGYVVLPLVWPALAAAGLLGLAAAVADLAATILVLPPGVETVAVRIFGLIHYGVDDRVAGAALALVIACVLLILTAVGLLAVARRRVAYTVGQVQTTVIKHESRSTKS